jgi:hypothetical protein
MGINSHLHYVLHGLAIMPSSGPSPSCNLARICRPPLCILHGMHSKVCQLHPASPQSLPRLSRMWNAECIGSNMVKGDDAGECNCIVGFIDVDTDFEGAFCVPSTIPYQITVLISLHPGLVPYSLLPNKRPFKKLFWAMPWLQEQGHDLLPAFAHNVRFQAGKMRLRGHLSTCTVCTNDLYFLKLS